MQTLESSAFSAVRPWNSADAGDRLRLYEIPQQDIEVCLSCELCASSCDRCDGHGNLRRKRGKQKIEIDTAMLRKMLMLKRCNAEMCAALGVSERTLIREKKRLMEGEIST